MTVGGHFERVAARYESLRTTDEAPVRAISQLLPCRPVTGLDIGCGTGRYTRLLRAVLPDGSRLAASDLSAAMLAQLKATSQRGHAAGVAPLRAAAEQLPVRAASLDVVTAFNCVHHFDLGRFLAAAARVLAPGGQLFIYTRTPQQNARTIWGRCFRLHRARAAPAQRGRAPGRRQAGGLTVAATQTFHHARTSTAGRLRAQAEARHYSTFSLYPPQELRRSHRYLRGLPAQPRSVLDRRAPPGHRRQAPQPGTTRRPRQPGEPGHHRPGPPDQRQVRRARRGPTTEGGLRHLAEEQVN